MVLSDDRLRALVRAPHVAIALDLDGTLIPHRATPDDARVDDDLLRLLEALLAAPGTWVTVVSGRICGELEEMLGGVSGLRLVAEHGAWRRANGQWSSLELAGVPPGGVESELLRIARISEGALIERKSWSVCLHYRQVRPAAREGLVVEASAAIAAWTRAHAEYEVLEGAMTLEVRHRGAHKGRGIGWIRAQLPVSAPVLAIGDDVTDEDMFEALGEGDVGIVVGDHERPTSASVRLRDPGAVRELLWGLARARAGLDPELRVPPLPNASSSTERSPLLVISNRLPDVTVRKSGESERSRNVGGLVAGVAPALERHGGTWLGWSGQSRSGGSGTRVAVERIGSVVRASFDLTPEQQARFYNGFANRGLWPALHGFVGRAHYDESEWVSYVEVNGLFAVHALSLVAPDTAIWLHDYHLFLAGAALRERGHVGPIGLFVHVPFPSIDTFETIPHARDIVAALCELDVVAFHVERYAENFRRTAIALGVATEDPSGLRCNGRLIRVLVLPLGIDAEPFSEPEEDDGGEAEIAQLQTVLGDRTLVLGVDRLDYTKGIPERLDAFARCFELEPAWRGRASLVQVAVPSRADVPEYVQQRSAIETAVGRINGELGEAHWVPVRYVYRSYGRSHLARLYRAARVGLVTPLRDGMNLVAKEYVAAQDPNDPGVLVLSRFAGAADELSAAILTNPYDRDGMARDILRALAMPLEERVARHAELLPRVLATTPAEWAETFLQALEAARASRRR